jgi:hypothetical protein
VAKFNGKNTGRGKWTAEDKNVSLQKLISREKSVWVVAQLMTVPKSSLQDTLTRTGKETEEKLKFKSSRSDTDIFAKDRDKLINHVKDIDMPLSR